MTKQLWPGMVFALSVVSMGPTERALMSQSAYDSMEMARQFLLDAYPELRGRNASIQFLTAEYPLEEPWDGPRRLELRITESPPERPGSAETLLSAEITFGFNGYVYAFRTVGPFVNTPQTDRLKADINTHWEWSDSQVLERINASSATYTPANTSAARVFEDKVHLLQGAIGLVQFRSATFIPRYEDNGVNDRAAVRWRVEVDAKAPDGTVTHYVLSYEPFDGRLTNLTTVLSW